ncbi:MAG: NrdH-redoxin [Rhodocyclaceae bacterium]
MSVLRMIAAVVLLLMSTSLPAQAIAPWVEHDADGAPQVQLYFFWSLSCPHCTAAHPFIAAIPQQRPWVTVHALELSRHRDHVERFVALAALAGEEASAVPSLLFCGRLMVGWDHEQGMGAQLLAELDACHARLLSDSGALTPQPAVATGGTRISLPLIGELDTATLSLPALTVVLAGLDAFNPCAFFVLLFLLSMMAHQKSRRRMLIIGGIFVTVSGLMYFAFMAAWLNLFQVFGHLGWVTLAAGALAVFVGTVNVKDFFWFDKGLSLSIPESRKPDIFRRARAILSADHLPAMLSATAFLAIAANVYELLCTAGFPMVFTRLLTLAELPGLTRYGYLAAYNLIYVLPLAAIVVVFARTLGARKLTEREGRLLKLMSGLMMLGLGALLLLAPERLSHVGTAFGLMAVAVALTWLAARLTRPG